MEAKDFIKILKQHRADLTTQQIKTLRGQAIKDSPAAAFKGLQKILERTRRHDSG